MKNDDNGSSVASVLESIRGTRDALTVRRVFGDPVEVDGVTVIPVARVAGGGGGGGGEGSGTEESGSGFGTGFGLRVHPVGVYRIRDGEVEWKPTVDVTLLARTGQMLGGIVVICVAGVAMRWLRIGRRANRLTLD